MTALLLSLRQVQRLQRYATYGHMKQLVLRMIADDVVAVSKDLSGRIAALRYVLPCNMLCDV